MDILAQITNVPESHFPLLGRLVVCHAFLDRELQATIAHLAKINRNAATSILNKISQTSSRAEILQNLAITKIRGKKRQAKLLVIADLIAYYSGKRNKVVHNLPVIQNADRRTIGYFDERVMTFPQIKIQPPEMVSPETLADWSEQMLTLGVWLGMLRHRHPHWGRDAHFPWQDKLRDKLTRERRKKTPTRLKKRVHKRRPQSSQG